MADEQQTIRDQILQRAQELFFNNGFARVTIDEVAGDLGISKKTLYLHFDSKEELFRAAILKLRDEIAGRIDAVVENPSLDFTEKLRGIMEIVAAKVGRVQRPYIEDMQKRFPELWKELEAFRRERIIRTFDRLFREGARDGMLRPDIDPGLFALMHLTLIQNIVNPQTVMQLPFTIAQIFQGITTVMVEGILTDEARASFRKKKGRKTE